MSFRVEYDGLQKEKENDTWNKVKNNKRPQIHKL